MNGHLLPALPTERSCGRGEGIRQPGVVRTEWDRRSLASLPPRGLKFFRWGQPGSPQRRRVPHVPVFQPRGTTSYSSAEAACAEVEGSLSACSAQFRHVRGVTLSCPLNSADPPHPWSASTLRSEGEPKGKVPSSIPVYMTQLPGDWVFGSVSSGWWVQSLGSPATAACTGKRGVLRLKGGQRLPFTRTCAGDLPRGKPFWKVCLGPHHSHPSVAACLHSRSLRSVRGQSVAAEDLATYKSGPRFLIKATGPGTSWDEGRTLQERPPVSLAHWM